MAVSPSPPSSRQPLLTGVTSRESQSMPPAPPSPDLALVDAAWDGDAECLQAVLDLGDVVDREARDEGGWTA